MGEIAVVLKLTVRVGLVIAVVVVVVTVFRSYHGKNCQIVGMGVAAADEDCLHQHATSTNWAEAQQQQLAMSWASTTTGLLYTEADGENPTTLTSGQSGDAFDLAWQYLQSHSRQPPGSKQAAGHVELKAAALMRRDGDTYAVLVINSAPCTYASGIGCIRTSALILPKGSTMVVWWPGTDKPATIEGNA